jgi:hypothetical protein
MAMRPSCTASVALAISRSLRAAFSGSEYVRSVANFICHPYHANDDQGRESKRADAQPRVRFAPINGATQHVRKVPNQEVGCAYSLTSSAVCRNLDLSCD